MNSSLQVAKTRKEERFDFCYERWIQGVKYMEIVREFATKFEDTERTAKNYLKKVKEYLAKAPDRAEQESRLNLARAQYRDLYSKLYQQGKYKEAADVRTKLDKIEGLDIIRIDQNVNTNQPTLDLSVLPLELLLQLQNLMPGQIIDVDYEEADYEEADQNTDENVIE